MNFSSVNNSVNVTANNGAVLSTERSRGGRTDGRDETRIEDDLELNYGVTRSKTNAQYHSTAFNAGSRSKRSSKLRQDIDA